MLRDTAEWEGKRFILEWQAGGMLPAREHVEQVSGVCFTEDGRIVLVGEEESGWGLPGGHPEAGEEPEVTLRREVHEEACCDVQEPRYLGCQKVTDESGRVHYQLRYWCLVTVRPFVPSNEVHGREPVPPEEFLAKLSYGRQAIAGEIFRLATECFAAYRAAI